MARNDTCPLASITNEEVAESLEEAARLLDAQGANPYRGHAYRRAAETLRKLPEPVLEILRRKGGDPGSLTHLPGIGENLARSIRQLVLTGRMGLLERLRGEAPPIALLSTVPGLGPKLVERIRDRLGIETLEELELAAHSGRLAGVPGFGHRRVQTVVEALAGRLGRPGRVRRVEAPEPPVAEILDVDAEYRRKVEEGTLPLLAPRRFNPERRAWLPVLHTDRPSGHYTALFSNTARAHALARTRDWVVIHLDDHRGERQATVVTEIHGPLAGSRVVRGREAECASHYGGLSGTGDASSDSPAARSPESDPGSA
jgi:DNA polymerase (family X)